MTAFALAEWARTLLALAGLGLAGGWVLWPFRAPTRPYLWLAAPLAGLAALSGALIALFYGCRLPFGARLAAGWVGCCGATLACALHSGLPRPGARHALVALAALIPGSAAAT